MSVEPFKGKNSKWGCYFNRDDPRVWVYRDEKYKAVGVTLNFAKAVSWVWLAARDLKRHPGPQSARPRN